MKKNLEQLKVQSFVTNISEKEAQIPKGGERKTVPCSKYCPTAGYDTLC